MADGVRPTWIALADDATIGQRFVELAGERLRVVPDRTEFAARLDLGRPAIAMLAQPPASDPDLTAAVEVRRRRRGLRIVHLSPPQAVRERLAALRSGFDEALPASLAPDELVARLELLGARARAEGHDGLRIGAGIVMDPIAHEVRRDGDRIHLRPKEYQLLAMLARHPGRAYTRRQLLDQVWGRGHVGDPRTIDVHVRWLRSKLEPHPHDPVHLVTVRGVGYRLDPTPR